MRGSRRSYACAQIYEAKPALQAYEAKPALQAYEAKPALQSGRVSRVAGRGPAPNENNNKNFEPWAPISRSRPSL